MIFKPNTRLSVLKYIKMDSLLFNNIQHFDKISIIIGGRGKMTFKEVQEKAKEMLKGYCGVCTICDGKACRGEVPGMGGIGTSSTYHRRKL